MQVCSVYPSYTCMIRRTLPRPRSKGQRSEVGDDWWSTASLLPILCRMRYTQDSNLGLTRACHESCRKRKKDLAATSLDSLIGPPQSTSVTTLLQHTGALHPAKTKWIQVTRSAWRFDSQWPENNLIKLRGLRCSMETVPKTSKNTHVYDMSIHKLPNWLTMTLYK